MKSRLIQGYDQYIVYENGQVLNINNGQWLTQRPNIKGYMRVRLYKNGKTTNHFVHRLVMLNLCPTQKPHLQVNHIDGNKTNNWLNNLEWCTLHENIDHAISTGLSPNIYKLSKEVLITILNEYLEGTSFRDLQKKYQGTSSLNTQLLRLATELGKQTEYKARRSTNAKIGGIKGRKPLYYIHQHNPITGELINSFNSVKEASEIVGISRPSITTSCDTGKPSKGYLWCKIPL